MNRLLRTFVFSKVPVRHTATHINGVYIPGEFRKYMKKSPTENISTEDSNEKPVVPAVAVETKPRIISPRSTPKTEIPMTRHDNKLTKYIQLFLMDILQSEPLPRALQQSIEIVQCELTPNRKNCVVWWRPIQGVQVNEKQVAELLDQYALLFKKLVAVRMSYGVNERKMPKFVFKMDKSGEVVDKLKRLMSFVEQEIKQ